MQWVDADVLNATAVYLKQTATVLRFYYVSPLWLPSEEPASNELLLAYPLTPENMIVDGGTITFEGLDLANGLAAGAIGAVELATDAKPLYRDDATNLTVPEVILGESVRVNGFQIVVALCDP